MKKTLFYRNKADIRSDQGVEVDAGALWELDGIKCVLVDDDDYLTAHYSPDLFVRAEN
ncbi:MAG TPA: hypothetical protein VFM82_07625 [Flavobacteriaceae bacterium]|nr:hypothetical protein [Flavobacteriaceae bacterium]